MRREIRQRLESEGSSESVEPALRVLCRSLEQLREVIDCDVRSVMVDFQDIREYRAAVQLSHERGVEIYLATPRIQKPDEFGIFRALAKHGAIVDEAIAYRTVPETNDISGGQARFREEGADVLTFASSSAVDSFFSLGLPLPKNLRILSIGPVTTATLKRHRRPPDIEAKSHDIPGMVAAIREHFEKS